jgi:DNA-binding CsgD family transcriptional regulator
MSGDFACHRPHEVPRKGRPRGEGTIPLGDTYFTGTCPSCGLARPPEDGLQRAVVLRAAIPRPIASALWLADDLSPRERVIFELLGLGYDNRSIARELEISERTTKRHVTAILAKLRLESRLQAGLTALIVSSVTTASGRLAQKSHGLVPGET